MVCISRPPLLSTCKNHALSREHLGSHKPKRASSCIRTTRNPAKTRFQDAHREIGFSYKTPRALPLQGHQTASAALDTARLSPPKTRHRLQHLNSPASRTPTTAVAALSDRVSCPTPSTKFPASRTATSRTMHTMLFKVLLLIPASVSLATARDVPENLRTLYQSVRARGTCSNRLADGFFATETGPDSAPPLPPGRRAHPR